MREVWIIGLGPGGWEWLPRAGWEALTGADQVLLRTGVHPIVSELESRGLVFSTCDDLYQSQMSFDQVYQAITQRVLAQTGPVLAYAVPGHPLVGEATVPLIRKALSELGVGVRLIPAPSYLDLVYERVGVDPLQGLESRDGLALGPLPTGHLPLLVGQVYNRLVAGEVKLWLLERYPPEHQVWVLGSLGLPQEKIVQVPICELDWEERFDHLTSLYLPPMPHPPSCRHPLDPLVEVMARLRSPQGCPWDQKQDHKTLAPYLIEEAYEVLEAIDEEDEEKLRDELGDLLLQIVFHTQLEVEVGGFTIDDVVGGIVEKLIRRHPHVFGDVEVEGEKEVLANWEQIKQTEAGTRERESLMDGIPRGLPALIAAGKVQKKAARVGFDWDEIGPVVKKVFEEGRELAAAWRQGEGEKVQEELGDLLFAIVNLARFLEHDPETALRGTVEKFKRRFKEMERMAGERGLSLRQMNLTEMDLLWDEAKKGERG